MFGYAIKKLALSMPTMLIVSVAIFGMMRLVPGDPVTVIAGDVKDTRVLEQIRIDYGLDQPLPVQYLTWLGRVLRGDLGRSLITEEAVLPAMLKKLAVTAQIVVPALLLSILAGVPAGLYAAWKQNRAADTAIMMTVILAISVPSFWAGILLILVFGVWLEWLPTVGYVSPAQDLLSGLSYLVLPTIAITFVELGNITRMMRSNAIEVIRQDYVTHALAKGAGDRRVLQRHVLKNAFAPTLTLLGLMLGSLLSGAAVVETVFSLPGLGRFLVDSIYARDYPVVQGILLLVAGIYVVTNLCVDLLYPYFDPRVRL